VNAKELQRDFQETLLRNYNILADRATTPPEYFNRAEVLDMLIAVAANLAAAYAERVTPREGANERYDVVTPPDKPKELEGCAVNVHRPPHTWPVIGRAYENADGSINIYLDALPTNGKLQVRR
jgi:hypothetical protein